MLRVNYHNGEYTGQMPVLTFADKQRAIDMCTKNGDKLREVRFNGDVEESRFIVLECEPKAVVYGERLLES